MMSKPKHVMLTAQLMMSKPTNGILTLQHDVTIEQLKDDVYSSSKSAKLRN